MTPPGRECSLAVGDGTTGSTPHTRSLQALKWPPGSEKCEGIGGGKIGRFKPNPALLRIIRSFSLGQYVLTLKCECGHTRTAQPQTLAALAGWDTLLADVVKRLRCSQCGRRRCSATVRPETKRDG
jgi:hypothetical protein